MGRATIEAAHPAVATTITLPSPTQLATLGTVLCLYHRQTGGELAGWSQAVHCASSFDVDSDGLHESLCFYDRAGECCWRLYLLPDSDFLAWERLLAVLPGCGDRDTHGGVGERLWRRLAARARGIHWQGSVLRLHALPAGPGFAHARQPVLAASLAPVSTLGAVAARRIARVEGAESELFVEDCCCRRASAAATRAATATHGGDDVFPLIRLNPREHP